MRYLMAIFVSFSMVFGACASKEPPVSKAAQVFKREVKGSLERLSPLFVEPTSKQNIETINQILDKLVSDSEKTGHPMAFGVVLLDKKGVSLAGKYPGLPQTAEDYSKYKHVIRALTKHEIAQGKLFLQDGSEIYAICSPLLRQGKVEGVLVLAFAGKEVKQRWDVSEKEFLSLDFNK